MRRVSNTNKNDELEAAYDAVLASFDERHSRSQKFIDKVIKTNRKTFAELRPIIDQIVIRYVPDVERPIEYRGIDRLTNLLDRMKGGSWILNRGLHLYNEAKIIVLHREWQNAETKLEAFVFASEIFRTSFYEARITEESLALAGAQSSKAGSKNKGRRSAESQLMDIFAETIRRRTSRSKNGFGSELYEWLTDPEAKSKLQNKHGLRIDHDGEKLIFTPAGLKPFRRSIKTLSNRYDKLDPQPPR